jgi:hypothetical protein
VAKRPALCRHHSIRRGAPTAGPPAATAYGAGLRVSEVVALKVRRPGPGGTRPTEHNFIRFTAMIQQFAA